MDVRLYETVIVLRPSLNEEDIQKILSQAEATVDRHGEVVCVDHWGKRKLAYEIEKERRGYYVLMRFRAVPKAVEELEHFLRYEEQVLRYMTTRLNKWEAARVEQELAERKAREAQRPEAQEASSSEAQPPETSSTTSEEPSS